MSIETVPILHDQIGYGIHYGEPASASGLSLHGQQLTSGALFPVNRRVVGSNLTWGANSLFELRSLVNSHVLT
jgi:hypothetical protein